MKKAKKNMFDHDFMLKLKLIYLTLCDMNMLKNNARQKLKLKNK